MKTKGTQYQKPMRKTQSGDDPNQKFLNNLRLTGSIPKNPCQKTNLWIEYRYRFPKWASQKLGIWKRITWAWNGERKTERLIRGSIAVRVIAIDVKYKEMCRRTKGFCLSLSLSLWRKAKQGQNQKLVKRITRRAFPLLSIQPPFGGAHFLWSTVQD